ncbi:Inosine-uridine preferring nucleoside hydrolase, putative [Entamoeba histolytica HM-1:IMSS-B]|uniref:Inosine-uridine preferring nucleoside hydrolase, putative n=7 Tax=Entamoeba histolytica TaxID=5759 RepID=C4M7L1_ENTH1|nr:Inosine-uridine preferring nucleoside hydrolase, putative [Entamoeba histolytica HM-1:IMSS]EMD48825.1 inosineuridine preferring nucleoside hydrolase, putative [Entamoeba histolytica KU27]EMH77574.1 Inosine-uridine preferring nucleoside hydrolase, putative [Entamoeba histolytica HM-1:IMSS-B]EMS15970.1 Inosine-uridine preferring nucleoside hydrolase [Entamoeba histolytica HM-3:IMSS]ENY65669.1 Inosine-uridine preferring nucleoside hydrolase, putative [Entamoeba histolytica HM-1:IMSS-A]BAN37566|eukprot:XP_654837.1 Inosine-uridine preferring nucleoside hydrolase, putative [Entamoeba histolytica HM-1:IMSS]
MRKLIIDTDCGVDDATAILLTIMSKKVDLVAITCVVGNTTLDHVINNVGRVLECCGRTDIPFYAGAKDNLLHVEVERFVGHGQDGFGNAEVPNTKLKPSSNRHAALEIIDLAKKYGKELDIVTIGPLTNIALAVSIEPNLFNMIGHFQMMIGSETCRGNSLPLGEFNCAYDPESAKIVFESVKDAVISSWDLTLKHLVDWKVFDKIKSTNKCGELIGKVYALNEKNLREIGFAGHKEYTGWVIPDPLCLMCYLFPEIITHTDVVETSICVDGLGRGATICDWFSSYHLGNPQKWIRSVDQTKLEELLVQIVEQYQETN